MADAKIIAWGITDHIQTVNSLEVWCSECQWTSRQNGSKETPFFNQASTAALLTHLLFPYLSEQFMLQLMIKTAYVCLLASLNKFPNVLGLDKTEHFARALYSHR